MGERDIVKFPSSAQYEEDQRLDRVKRESEILANQSEVERAYRIPKLAEALGVSAAILKTAVHVVLKQRAERAAAVHLQQYLERQRQEKQRRAEDRKRERAEKEATKKTHQDEKVAATVKHRAEKAAANARQEAEKEAERKRKERAKALEVILRLPVARQDRELAKVATQFGEDVTTLRQELKDLAGVTEDTFVETEPWPEPVDLAKLLRELSDKIARYVVVSQPHQMTTTVLWTAHCWLYDHDVPVHSPMLAATSAEPNSGKSTLITVTGHACPRFRLNVEMTGPTLFRFVDQHKPTLALDEADDIFKRRSDLTHVANAGWTRGTKIPRQEKIGGVWQTVWFDPFTPKAIALLGSNLPSATRSRCIELRMVPKRADEKVEDFNETDDTEFAMLRRKFARWAADNAAALKAAKPTMPSRLNNRAAANWKLLLAIAELAGGSWPELGREAAQRLTHDRHRPSDGVRLLAAVKVMFVASGKKEITSEAIVTELIKDPTDIWIAFKGGPVTQRQVAWLLGQYDIEPVQLHPTARSDFSRRGYKAEQFMDAFARYLSFDPINQSQPSPKNRKRPRKKEKQRSTPRSKRQ